MSRAWRRFLEDTLYSLAANAGAGFLNLAQLVLCGRMLDKAAFGTLGSLLACVWLSTALGNMLSLAVTREVAGYPGGVDAVAYARVRGLRCLRRAWSLILTAFAASPLVARMLHTGSLEVLAMVAAVGALLASSVAQGMTAGVRRFRLQAWLVFTGAALKLAGTAGILALAPTVVGALVGSALGYLFVSAGTLVALHHEGGRAGAPKPRPVGAPWPVETWLGLAYLLAFAPFMMDQVMVQTLAPALAGDYMALATLGKLTFHGVAPILAVLYAYLVAHRLEPQRQDREFRLGATLAVVLSAAVAGAMSMRPAFVAGTLFATRYEQVAAFLPAYAFGVVAFTLAHGIVVFFLARNETRMIAPLAGAFLLQMGLLLARHGSLAALAWNQVVSYGVMALALLAQLALGAGRAPARVASLAGRDQSP